MDEALDSVLGGAVDRLAGDVNETGDRAGNEDVAGPLRGQVRQDGVDTAQDTIDVHVQDARPVVRAAVHERFPEENAGIGEQGI